MSPAVAPPAPPPAAPIGGWTAAQQQQFQEAVLAALALDDLREIVRYAMNQTLDHHVKCDDPFRTVVFNWLVVVQQRGWNEMFVRAVYTYRPLNPLLVAYCTDHARYVFAPTARQQADNAADRIAELVVRARRPDAGAIGDLARDAAGASANTLDRIDRMGWYKELHDILHSLDYGLANELRRSVGLLRLDPARFRATFSEVRSLRTYCGQLDERVAAAVRVVGLLPVDERADEAVWAEQLAIAAESIRRAVEPGGDPATADVGLNILAKVLAIQPGRINARVVELVDGVDLPGLADRLRRVSDVLLAGDSLADRMALGLNDLSELGPRVAALVAEHHAWQRLDNPLRTVLETLDLLAVMWPQVRKLGRELAGAHEGSGWAAELLAAINRFEGAQDTVGRAFAFDDFHQVASRRFRAVDAGLLELATPLRRIAAEFYALSEVRAHGNS